MRSNIGFILPTGFLPPPKLCKQDEKTGLLTALNFSQKSENAKFLPLFQNLSLNTIESTDHKIFEVVPYDFYCPTVQSELSNRICTTCHLYFASEKALGILHAKSLKHSVAKKKPSKLKLSSIEVARKEEVLCIFKDEDTGIESAEWIDKTDIESVCVDKRETEDQLEKDDSQWPIIESMEEWLQNPWTAE